MLKVLVCSDSFKGTLDSKKIASLCSTLVERKYRESIDLSTVVLADGGEGSLEAFDRVVKGKLVKAKTVDAEGSPIETEYLCFDKRNAMIEVAKIVGLPLIQNKIEREKRTTEGIGRVIKDAIGRGVSTIYLCLGGTSTNDFGLGMLRALGLKALNGEGAEAKDLSSISSIDESELKATIDGVRFIGLSDVNNPLTGPRGATYTFGPQKGYSQEELDRLEKGMAHLNGLIMEKKGLDLSSFPGAGAAGGLGGAIYAFLGGELRSGIDTLLQEIHFESLAKEADYVVTGEGCFDDQSLNGKVISGILRYVDPSKLVIICGKSKVQNDAFRVFETSAGINDFQKIKTMAAELYVRTFDKFLQSVLRKED
ncbi:MAG: glycerate kinase [Candidatus Enteromonas sp.]